MIAPIDCGRIASARASALPVVGPSRSSRRSTDFWAEVRSPDVGLLTEPPAERTDHDAKLCGEGFSAFWIG